MTKSIFDIIIEDESKPAGIVQLSTMSTGMDASIWASHRGVLVFTSFIGPEMAVEAAIVGAKVGRGRLMLTASADDPNEITHLNDGRVRNPDDYVWLRQHVSTHMQAVTIYHKSLYPSQYFGIESWTPANYYIPALGRDFVLNQFYEIVLRTVTVPVQRHWAEWLWDAGEADSNMCCYLTTVTAEGDPTPPDCVNSAFAYVTGMPSLWERLIKLGLKNGDLTMSNEQGANEGGATYE